MSEDITRCAHGRYASAYECAECVGPMNDAELARIRRRLADHESCVPKCENAPSGETARLIATVDSVRAENEALRQAAANLVKSTAGAWLDCRDYLENSDVDALVAAILALP